MAPKSVLSPTVFVPLFPFTKKTITLTLFSRRKPSPVSCRSPSSPSTFAEPEGTGAAAPTRGDLFLDRHNSMSASKIVLKEKKRKNKKTAEAKVSTSVACCYGCGAPLQTVELDAPGYVDTETYELKKRHRQLRTILCGRCKLLSHGRMLTAVGGHGGYSGGKQFVLAEELREKLSHLRQAKVLIVKLVDIVDFNGSFLARVRDLSGANPIILVVTKVDLLPKGTDLNCVGDWVVEATMKKKLNVVSVHLTSSKSLVGVSGVISEIQKEKKGRDVYILGAANVGKSAFINALLKMMATKDPVAAAAQKYKPIQSAVPGTTLGPIQIDAFQGGGKLFDTPGVHLHHRQAAVVHSEDLPILAPQSRLRGQSFPAAGEKNTVNGSAAVGLNGLSIFWGGLVRIDVLKVPPCTVLTFYGPRKLQIFTFPTAEADDFYQVIDISYLLVIFSLIPFSYFAQCCYQWRMAAYGGEPKISHKHIAAEIAAYGGRPMADKCVCKEVGITLTPPTGRQRETWSGLQSVRHLQIKYGDQKRPATDIAISGLGWIAVEPFGRQATNDNNSEECTAELQLAVHVPKPVEIFVRPPIPVGKAGSEWYQYQDLTEKEEELRPKWYY